MQSSLKWYLLVAVHMLALDSSVGHPKGAPTSVCHDLIPQHSAEPQSSPPPFTLSANVLNGSHINLVIESPDNDAFKGFAIQARRVNASHEAIGRFVVNGDDAHTINCFHQNENTITHSNRKEKKKLVVTWIVPNQLEADTQVVFAGTILKSVKIFWTDVQSAPVKVGGHSYGGDEKKVSNDESMFSVLLTMIGKMVSGDH